MLFNSLQSTDYKKQIALIFFLLERCKPQSPCPWNKKSAWAMIQARARCTASLAEGWNEMMLFKAFCVWGGRKDPWRNEREEREGNATILLRLWLW